MVIQKIKRNDIFKELISEAYLLSKVTKKISADCNKHRLKWKLSTLASYLWTKFEKDLRFCHFCDGSFFNIVFYQLLCIFFLQMRFRLGRNDTVYVFYPEDFRKKLNNVQIGKVKNVYGVWNQNPFFMKFRCRSFFMKTKRRKVFGRKEPVANFS